MHEPLPTLNTLCHASHYALHTLAPYIKGPHYHMNLKCVGGKCGHTFLSTIPSPTNSLPSLKRNLRCVYGIHTFSL